MTLPVAYKDRCRGSAFLEMLLAVAILGMIFAASIPLYTTLQVSAQLNESTNELVQILRTARTQAVARVNNVAHGVHFASDRYTLYQGSSYASRDTSYDRVIIFDSAITASNTLSNDINFSRSLGLPNATGTVTITHDVQGAKTITIDEIGSVQ